MMSLVGARSSYTLPRVLHWAEIRPTLVAMLRTLYERCVSLFLTLLIAGIGMYIVLVSMGVHVPLIHLPSKAASAQAIFVKPKLVAAPVAISCSAPQSQTNALFSTCPSFSADYSKLKSGSVNTQNFNVYTGAPVANHEDEYYTDNTANIRVENGSLVLEAQNQSDQGYDFTSARVDTHGKEDFLYGKIVVNATMPAGVGTWPAIWLLPSQPKYASLSSASDKSRYLNDGEIDIAEAVGTQPNVIYGIAHSLAYPEDGINHAYFNTLTVPNNDTTSHAYELDWTPTSLTFSVDGQVYFTYTKQANADWRSWPFDQPFYLVMNLALGGSWGGQDTAQFPGNGVDASALPTALKIQSVNYYSYIGQ